MNSFAAVILLVAVAAAIPIGYDYAEHDVHAVHVAHVAHVNPAAHIPSGSIGVSQDGAVIAGPAGSIKTDNGLHGLGAGAIVAGPSGNVHTQGGHAELTGPGSEHEDAHYEHNVHDTVIAVPAPLAVPTVAIAAPAVFAAPVAHHGIVAGPAAHASIVGPSADATIVGPSSHANIVGPSSHATIVGPSSHATIVGATSHTVLAAPVAPVAHHSFVAAPVAHHGFIAAPVWGHGANVFGYEHGALYAGHGHGVHGHHGW